MIAAICVLAGLAALTGAALVTTASRVDTGSADPLIDRVNDLLPQTQCAQCGYPGCRPYATAIVAGEVPINRCAPGGGTTIAALARLLERESLQLDTAFGHPQPQRVAVIDEAFCIGCIRCLEACPVDAITGAPRFMHTVITDRCTGCELCVPPCPVDCIELVSADSRS
jgi:electron transport complex protein RnfB